MKTWPDSSDAIIRQHLRQVRLRPSSLKTYHPMLVEFQRFVVEHSPERCVSPELLENWLRHRASFSSAQTILQRVWPINRFLDWLVKNRLVASNPLAELERDLGRRDIAQIIRALLSPDSTAALEALRPTPQFASHLGSAMRDHVTLMRSLGLRYHTQGLQLLRFDRFLQKRADLVGQPIVVLVREWSKEDPRPQHLLEAVQTGRLLGKAMQRTDPSVVAPLFDNQLYGQVRQKQRRPYIYSEEEVQHLLKTARSFPSPETPLRPQMLYTILVLAYCVGLRIGEIVHLTVGDVHLEDQTIEIRETKFFKYRRLPITATLMSALRAYLAARRREGAPSEQSAPLFWQPKTSRGYRYHTVTALLVQVIRRAGLKPAPGRLGPRIHDLRHSFVVNRIVAWYREGINPQARLPYLATYLGHKDINSTLVYVTITQELLQQAGDRFRAFAANVVQTTMRGGAYK
jgi:integrase/recombinase XerD